MHDACQADNASNLILYTQLLKLSLQRFRISSSAFTSHVLQILRGMFFRVAPHFFVLNSFIQPFQLFISFIFFSLTFSGPSLLVDRVSNNVSDPSPRRHSGGGSMDWYCVIAPNLGQLDANTGDSALIFDTSVFFLKIVVCNYLARFSRPQPQRAGIWHYSKPWPLTPCQVTCTQRYLEDRSCRADNKRMCSCRGIVLQRE